MCIGFVYQVFEIIEYCVCCQCGEDICWVDILLVGLVEMGVWLLIFLDVV